MQELLLRSIESLTLDETVQLAEYCNAKYRDGCSVVSDDYYDHVIIKRIIQLNPDHRFLKQVEVDGLKGKIRRLPDLMLSTQKCYSYNELDRWLFTIIQMSNYCQVPLSEVQLRATPKLDGYAIYDDGLSLMTRGDGTKGTDVTYILDRGVRVLGKRGLGPGELVISKSYFKENLEDHYENARNFQGSVLREQQLSIEVQEACNEQAIIVHPFSLLPGWQGSIDEFKSNKESIIDSLWDMMDFYTDGVVIEVLHPIVKERMGHTNHHHRWQIAYKRNEEAVDTTVLEVIGQTGKTGQITPVAIVEPVRVSNAMVERVTVYNYGHIKDWKLGVGSHIKLVRSGLVIPKIVDVITPGEVIIPHECPSCHSPVGWENNTLYCSNTLTCPAQVIRRLEYYFKTLGNIDGFGPATIEILVSKGINTLNKIYALDFGKLRSFGFGSQQSAKLLKQLENSRLIAVEDWRFLAAFNIPMVGKGGCKVLLQHIPLAELFNASVDDIIAIRGFDTKTAEIVVNSLKAIKSEYDTLDPKSFNLTITPLVKDTEIKDNLIKGKKLVFTGTMKVATREVMERQAESYGVEVSSSVTSKTDYLIVGDNPGQSKIKAATRHNTKLLNEEEYREMLNVG